MAFRFEGLEIFHAANDFSAKVYETTKKFPSEERFDLTSQARCAANFDRSEYCRRLRKRGKKDFSHFLDMALGSTFETVACFFVARKQSYVSEHDLEEMKRDGESLSRRINAFKRTLK